LDLATIKVPEPVSIVIDHREPSELVELLRGLPNVEVEHRALDLGDILINDRVIVERKCCDRASGGTDFEASVIEDGKRLFNQSERLKFADDMMAVILLEG